MTNDHLLQNVYGKVVYVNPFSREFEETLHNEFELKWNNPTEVSKRQWTTKNAIPNKHYSYFHSCRTSWRQNLRSRGEGGSGWVEITDAEAEALKGQGTCLFFYPGETFEVRMDADEPFEKRMIVERFGNVYFTEPNLWSVFNDLGNVTSLLESERLDTSWKIVPNASAPRSSRKTHFYDFPISSFRQFREDMHRVGVQLRWKEGISMNHPNLEWRQRNEPGLSHLVDLSDNGFVVVQARGGINTVKLPGGPTFVIDHGAKTAYAEGVPLGLANQELAKDLYRTLWTLMTSAGRDINYIRDKHSGNVALAEAATLDEILLQLQRKLTI